MTMYGMVMYGVVMFEDANDIMYDMMYDEIAAQMNSQVVYN